MSDKIHKLITDVREKVSQIHNRLLVERANNLELIKEIEILKNTIESKTKEMENVSAQNREFQNTLNAMKTQNVMDSKVSELPEGQIDELVREIEYCIQQLKK